MVWATKNRTYLERKQHKCRINRSDFQTSLSSRSLTLISLSMGLVVGTLSLIEKVTLKIFNVASFSTDSIGANVSFRIPNLRNIRINFNIGFENTQIEKG